MHAFLADLVPSSMRGLELNRGIVSMGALSQWFVYYEHVNVVEMRSDNHGRNDTITLTFKNYECSKLPVQ